MKICIHTQHNVNCWTVGAATIIQYIGGLHCLRSRMLSAGFDWWESRAVGKLFCHRPSHTFIDLVASLVGLGPRFSNCDTRRYDGGTRDSCTKIKECVYIYITRVVCHSCGWSLACRHMSQPRGRISWRQDTKPSRWRQEYWEPDPLTGESILHIYSLDPAGSLGLWMLWPQGHQR